MIDVNFTTNLLPFLKENSYDDSTLEEMSLEREKNTKPLKLDYCNFIAIDNLSHLSKRIKQAIKVEYEETVYEQDKILVHITIILAKKFEQMRLII